MLLYRSPAAHPHVRGAQESPGSSSPLSIGPSPRAWGSDYTAVRDELLIRPIPTCVGLRENDLHKRKPLSSRNLRIEAASAPHPSLPQPPRSDPGRSTPPPPLPHRQAPPSLLTMDARRRRRSGPPEVTDVGLSFLVPRPVRPFDRDEAVPFIKTPRRLIDLEGPQGQPVRTSPFGQGDEPIPEASSSPRRVEVELVQLLTVERQEPDHRAFGGGHPGLAPRHDHVREPGTHLGVIVRSTH